MLTKITDVLRNVKYGLQNYWKWARIIYNDRDWDWVYLYRIMAYKMECMANSIEVYGCHAEKDKTVQELRDCATRLKRIEMENYEDEEGNFLSCIELEQQIQKDEEWVYLLMKAKARTWWD